MSFGDGDLNLPFQEGPPGQTIPLTDAKLASGMVVMAGVLPVPGQGLAACLIYRFAIPDGSGFYPPIALIVSDDEIFMSVKITQDAARAAVREAKRQRAART